MDPTVIQSLVIVPLQLIIGKFIKNNPNIANGLIFWINWVIGTISNAIAPYIVTPAHASTGSSILTVATNPFILGFLQSIAATGFHSTFKNLLEMLGALGKQQTPSGIK